MRESLPYLLTMAQGRNEMREKKTKWNHRHVFIAYIKKVPSYFFHIFENDWIASGMAVTTFVVHKRRKITIERQLVRVFLPVKGEGGG